MQVANEKVVSIDYTLTDSLGKVLDSSKGSEPLTYLHGKHGIIPGLEAALDGKNQGDSVQVTVPPDQAYGPRREDLVQAVPRDRFPGEMEVKTGMQFQAQTPQGTRIVTVVAVDETNVHVDANHPLAGMELHFDVTVVEVRDATADELAHGHVHSGGHGHHH